MLSLRSPARRRSGSSLIPTLLVITVAVAFVSVAGALTSQFGRQASAQQGNDEAMAGADSALEYAYSYWKKQVKAKGNNAPTNEDLRRTSGGGATVAGNKDNPIDLTSLASGFSNFAGTGTTLSGLTILAVNPDGSVAQAVDANNRPTVNGGALKGQNTQNVPGYPGWAGLTYYYKTEATVRSSRFGTTSNAVKVTRYFQFTNVPLFQAAIFYENKLEIYPGADMNVTGLVHTNADIWAQPFFTSTVLQFKSNVSHIGGFTEGSQTSEARKGWAGGTVDVNGYPAYFAAAAAQDTWSDGQLSSSSAAKANQLHQVSAIDPFGGTSQSNNGLRDMIEPADSNTSNQKVVNNASVIVTVDSSKLLTDATRVTVTGGNGVTLTANDIANVKAAITAPPPASGTGAVVAPPAAGLTTSNGVIYDQREGNTVYVTDVDMGKLERALAGKNPVTNAATASALASGGTYTGYNGVVYIRDAAGTTTDALTGLTEGNRAIRLKSGANLSNDGGLNGVDTTIGSDNAVYIQGDFNVGTGTVPSNTAYNATTATTDHWVGGPSGYQRASCAVMADAVTVLSNSFVDSRSNNLTDFSNRTATPTTVNCAILAGDVPTNRKDAATPNGNGYASGGAHNFPRFLENWSGVNFTYWGSLVEAFRSERATGVWKTGNVYQWPNRRWSFDTQFLTRAPRGTPQGVQFARGRWERASL